MTTKTLTTIYFPAKIPDILKLYVPKWALKFSDMAPKS